MTDELQVSTTSSNTRIRHAPWIAFGIANVAVILTLTLASWWLLVDPVTNVIGWTIYPEPFTSGLFWTIIVVVFVGFSLQFHGFDSLKQPARGAVLLTLTVVVAIAITAVLAVPLAEIAPSFSAERPGGAGYSTGSQWVLYAFVLYVMSVVNWNHWPWTDDRVLQPWKGWAEIAALIVPTTVLYSVVALPNLLVEGPDPLIGLEPSIGYFYSCIVSIVLTGNLTDNWPWRLAGSPGRTAAAAAFGNFLLGGLIYVGLRELVEFIVGEGNVLILGESMASMPAQIGVCWVLWAIAWPNAFSNYPNGSESPLALKYFVRLIITFGLAVVTYIGYYFGLASTMLHEPYISPTMAGNALGFIDLLVLWSLWYLLCFNSWGLRRFAPKTAAQ